MFRRAGDGDPGVRGDPGPGGTGGVRRPVFHDQVDVQPRIGALVQAVQEPGESAESLRAIGSAMTCPVAACSAAVMEIVPLRTYSNSRRASRPGLAAAQGICGTWPGCTRHRVHLYL